MDSKRSILHKADLDEQYVIIVFNPLTLSKAIYYIDNYWGKDNSTIVFASCVFSLPEGIANAYNCVVIPSEKIVSNDSFKTIIKNVKTYKKDIDYIYEIVLSVFDSKVRDYYLVVFKDNNIREVTCIERLKNDFKDRIKIILIEEGSALYTKQINHIRFRLLRQFFNNIFKVSNYTLHGFPQGLHPLLDAVVCTSPDSYLKKQSREDIEVIKQDFIFNDSFCNRYMELVFDYKNEYFLGQIDYVFLTTPWSDISDSISFSEYTEFLNTLFNAVNIFGRILIKKHPRDTFCYSCFTNECVVVEDKFDTVPFEVVYSFLQKPVLISLISSACACDKTVPSFYIFPCIEKLKNKWNYINIDFLESNNIVLCENIKDLSTNLLSLKEGNTK